MCEVSFGNKNETKNNIYALVSGKHSYGGKSCTPMPGELWGIRLVLPSLEMKQIPRYAGQFPMSRAHFCSPSPGQYSTSKITKAQC